MDEIGITRRQAAELKKKVIEREGGICSENSEQLLAIDKMVTEPGDPIPVMEELAEKERAVVVEVVEDVPVNIVSVPEQRPLKFNEDQISLIKAKIAPNATNTEFELLMYMSRKYNLDPLLRQIWLVKFQDSPAQIYAGRDGFLEIAHRSGQFDGLESWCEYTEVGTADNVKKLPLRAFCTVWRKDCSHPFKSEVLFTEYTTGRNLWLTKPSVMLIKVAESVCLRKAFRVSVLYDPDEMGP